MNDPGNPTLEGRVLGGGRYRLLRLLGRGGMGVVYEAVQVDLGRRVAIKLLDGDVSPSALARLGTEAQVMARLGNPHVAQINDFLHPPGEPAFLVMELLVGQSLSELLRAEGVIAWERAARIGMQILDALGAAHAARVVHRDVKPGNVFMVASAAVPDMVKVLDFGIAKVAGGEDSGPITRPGAAIGTVSYMAPEQAFGEPVDGRADLYAVGVCLYQAVSGRRPFEGADPRTILAAMMVGVPVPLEKYCPHVPVAFRNVVERALRRYPAERYPSAQEMIGALAASLGVTSAEAPITIPSASSMPRSFRRDMIPETTADVPVSAPFPQGGPHLPRAPEPLLYPTMTSRGLGAPILYGALGPPPAHHAATGPATGPATAPPRGRSVLLVVTILGAIGLLVVLGFLGVFVVYPRFDSEPAPTAVATGASAAPIAVSVAAASSSASPGSPTTRPSAPRADAGAPHAPATSPSVAPSVAPAPTPSFAPAPTPTPSVAPVAARAVRLGAEVTAAYDYAQVMRVAGARTGALNACVNAADFDPATDADNGYEMHYDAAGHVDHVVRHEKSHTSVSPCIKAALNGLALGVPKSGGPSAVVLVVRTKQAQSQ